MRKKIMKTVLMFFKQIIFVENVDPLITLNIWLPNSLDCNPLDYYLLGIVEWMSNKTLGNTKNEL